MTPFIRLHPQDDVLIARTQLLGGSSVEGIAVRGLIPPGHKIAARAIAAGAPVRRYNQIIGFATPGHCGGRTRAHPQPRHGRRTRATLRATTPSAPTCKPEPPRQHASFMGIRRADGRVATRNYIGILSSVNCSATAARAIADHFSRQNHPAALADFPQVDGVVALTHGTGCGMDTDGVGLQILQRTLAGYATHANFWGVLVVGLGCEANQINAWLAHSRLREGDTLKVFNIQDTGGTAKTVAKGIALVKDMLPRANAVQREPCSAEHITLGLQCGGSDGYSGISANPALGAAVDLLVAHGGSAILSETPEIYGAEHLLTRRAVRREVAEKLIARIRWWEHYTQINDGEMNNNPSPGNKAGGLTTILEKSLGAVAKGGTSNLQAVYEYAEPVDRARLRLHGHTRLRPGQRHRPGGGRRQPHLLYHRARLAPTAARRRPRSSSPPTPRCGSGKRRTWTSTAARSSTAASAWPKWASVFLSWCWPPPRARPAKASPRLRPERVCALAGRRRHVNLPSL